jgi:signal transduction histidine kinase
VQLLHRTRERFFAMVNHELRNSLAAVYGWAEMLVRKKDPTTVPRAAFEVLDSAQQAIGLINDLLDLSRLDEDRLKPVIRAVDPGSVANKALSRMTPTAEGKAALQVEVDAGLPACNTDASRVEQILVNLMGNAIQHCAAGGTVRVQVSAADGRVSFTVDNDGTGVPPEEVERIFDIYVSKKENEAQGVGLGLPLSRRLARLLGGELRAVPLPGRGRFVLDLPAAPTL